MANPPRQATVESLCREIQLQILMLSELQPDREVLSVPRSYAEAWFNMLTRVIVLALHQQAP